MSDLPKLEMVPFYGDEIEAIRHLDGTAYVVPRRICENLGVAWQRQLSKLKAAHWSCVTMMVTRDTTGRAQDTVVIPLDSVPMWLVTIHESKVDEAIRPKLVRYQKEARDVLARHFFAQANQLAPADPAIAAVLATIMAQIQAQQVQTMTMLQGQQVQLEHLRADMDRWGELNRHQIGSQANPYRTIPPGYETHERFTRSHHLRIDARERKRELPYLKRLPGVTPLYYRLDDSGVLYRLFPTPALVAWFNDYMRRHPEARDGYLPGLGQPQD